jgi:ATP-binding cassette subfamily B protein
VHESPAYRDTFVRLIGFLRPYKGSLVVSIVLAVASQAAQVALAFLTGEAVGRAVRHHDRGALKLIVVLVVAVGLAKAVFMVGRRLISGRQALAVEFDLRDAVYARLVRLSFGFYDRHQTGQLMSRATVDLQAVRFFLGYGLIFIAQSAITILVAAAVMIAVNPGLAGIALFPTPFVLWAAYRYGTRNRPASQEVQQRIAELTAEAEESISGVRLVKAFAREERQLARFSRAARRVFDQSMVSTRLRAFYNPFIGFLPQLGLAAVLLVGGRQAVHGTITVGEFVAFYGYVTMLSSPVRMLGVALGMSQRAVASGARVFEILDRRPRMTSPPGAPPLPAGDGHVELRGVTFAYETGEPVLSELDLDVPAGRTVAIVGPTGSGKTSLVSLLPRLYDPTQGTVAIDGADLRAVDVTSLREEVGLVSDEPFLFSDSIAENIAYARPDASAAEVEAAARRAGIHDFIAGLPDGYGTLVGERGLTLSGGQRQRVAIARALIKDPRVLILDDATSSVDATTEAEIKRALRELMRDRTTVIIGHRLSTVALADEIVVLEDGRIAERGTHEELIERSPLYREIAEKGMPDQVFLTRKPAEREVASL